MKLKKDIKGFTLVELLVAVTIMAVGFLAVSQMQFLAFRQKTLANDGVNATNVIQFAADRDLAEIKKRYLLNSFTYLKGLNTGTAITPATCIGCFDYCGAADRLCVNCPCDPFDVVITDATNGGATGVGAAEIRCSAIDLEDFDPDKINYVATNACAANCPANTECLYLVRSARTQFTDNPFDTDNITLTITYGIKNLRQIMDAANRDVLSIRETLAVQNFQISGNVTDTWGQYVTGWNAVNIPHVP